MVARGRVWSGRDALEIGLVDVLGGLRDAVRIARERAGLPDDAPVVRAGHVPLLARLGTATNSEDPRAVTGVGLPGRRDLAAVVGSATDAELDAFARERLAPPKRPKTYRHLPELPRTLTGKVRRQEL